MSRRSSKAPPERSSCLFCNIANKLENTEFLYEDEFVCCFRDIKPASRFHILTIPKIHIDDVTSLNGSHKDLILRMFCSAKQVLNSNNFTDDSARFGYHWPPFRSVKHLHLHTIAPVSEMGYMSKLIFRKESYWFVSPEYVDSLI